MRLSGSLKSLGLLAVLSLSVNIPSSSVVAQPGEDCFRYHDGHYEPASTTTRTIELSDLGIRVQIPENYRSMSMEDGSVRIVHPDDFAWLECVARGGFGGGGYYYESISRVEREPGMTLLQQARFQVGSRRQQDGSLFPTGIIQGRYQRSGLDGYIVRSETGLGVAFLGTVNDSRELIRISPSCDCEVILEDLADLLSRISAIP